jgi:hypothetical protein
MRFVLTIDLDELTGDPDDTGAEVGRILRYWGGAAKDLDWTTPTTRSLTDSSYARVGEFRITP